MIKAPHSPLLCKIAEHAINTPDKVALVEAGHRVTYAQLIAHVESAAGLLMCLRIKQGDRILLMAQKELEFIYLYLACHLMGVVCVVVDSSAPQERLNYIARVVNPVMVFDNRESSDKESDPCRQIDEKRGLAYGCPAVSLSEINRFDESIHPESVPSSIAPTDIADVMFTTGTTGAPKGVCLSHANIAGSASNTIDFIGTNADDIEALALPLSHSFGLGRMRCVLMVGATLVLVNNFANLKSFFSVLEQEHVTGFGMVPAVWQYLKRLSGTRIARFAKPLNYIEIGSAALPVEDKRLLMELFPDTRLCMHYGLTEASRALFTEFHADAANLDSVGRPASSLVDVCVLNDDGRPVADGTDGEICVRGNMVTKSYFLEEDNRDAFFGDWFRTGDWGHRDSNGNIYLTGRKKELINVGGEKVSPAAIEQAICSLGVADCACIAVPDPNGVLGEVPKAFLVAGNERLSFDSLKDGLSRLLPPHEIPVLWEWVDSIPRTASGKIQRLKLK